MIYMMWSKRCIRESCGQMNFLVKPRCGEKGWPQRIFHFFLSALTHLVKLIGFGELRNSVFFMLLAKSKSRQKYAELIYRFPVSDCFHWSFSSWEASKESLLHRPGKQPNGRASCSWRITHLCFVGQSCHQMPLGFTAVPKQGYPKTNGL